MPETTTKVPGIIARIMEVMDDGKSGESIAAAIVGIGASMGAAGVVFSGSTSPAATGLLTLDNSLPVALAAAQTVDGGFSRGKNG